MLIRRHAIGRSLLDLFPWVPEGTRRVVIDIPYNDLVVCYIELLADMDEITVNALAGLTGGEVVAVSPKPVEPQPARKAPDTSSKTDRLK